MTVRPPALAQFMNSPPLVLPEALPDETFYSLVARIYRLNEEETEREFCAHLLGEPEQLRVADAEVHLSQFAKITHGFYGNAENLLATTTLDLVYRRLGTTPDVEVPKLMPVGEDPSIPRAGLATLSNGRPNIWRVCRSCVTQDWGKHGIAYWHRAHQLPGATVCLIHKELLLELNLSYGERQRSFVFPDQFIDRFDRISSGFDSRWWELTLCISELSEQALLDNVPANPTWAIQGALVDGFAERGLLTRSRRVNKQAFVEEFNAFYSKLASTREFSPFLVERSLLSLADRLTRETLLIPAVLTLMLALWLFGSWELFRERCRWRNEFHTNATPSDFFSTKKSRTRERADLRSAHRQTCLDFLETRPDAMRRDFWIEHPKSCRWLSQHDENWLLARLPLRYGCHRTQLKLF